MKTLVATKVNEKLRDTVKALNALAESQHTPTPWRSINGAIFEIRKSGNVAIQYALAVCGDINAPRNETGNLEANEQDKANAAFIVKAVNAYDSDQKKIKALVEAANELLANMADSGADTNEETGETYPDVAKLEKAIHQAGE